jgi:hypothetical protein
MNKPASAPPADALQQVVAEMSETAAMYPDSPFASTVNRWAKTLAASAQVREAEACECHVSDCCPAHNRRIVTPTTKPAAEPVPVAQGVADRLSWLARDAVIVADATCIDVSLAGFRDTMTQAIATIADHARSAERQHFLLSCAEQRAEQAEASLAACRALVPKWRDQGVISNECADELAAVLALAGEVAK